MIQMTYQILGREPTVPVLKKQEVTERVFSGCARIIMLCRYWPICQLFILIILSSVISVERSQQQVRRLRCSIVIVAIMIYAIIVLINEKE